MLSTTTIQLPIWTKDSTVISTVVIEHIVRGQWRVQADPACHDDCASYAYTVTNEKHARRVAKTFLELHAKVIDGMLINLNGQGVFNV